jgi:hypothetical protein
MFEHLTPELVISALRLLMEGYKVGRDRFKDKKTPDRVEEIVTRAEKTKQIDTKEIERSLAETLDPTDAAIVKGDLELLSLLMLPAPSLDAFDYWGKLTQLVNGLQAYAHKNRLFELRGVKKPELGEVILLPRTGSCILPEKLASGMPIPYQMQSVKDTSCLALLRKVTVDFPIIVLVGARFNEYSPVGGPPSVISDGCYFDIAPGQQRHWLRFDRGQRYTPHFHQSSEYRLEASDFISIVNALRDDIRQYAAGVQADEQKIAPLFTQIDAFVEKMKT